MGNKVLCLCFSVLFSGAVLRGAVLPSEGVHYQKGMSYFDKKNYPKALDKFLQQLDETPQDVSSKRMIKQIGRLLLEKKKNNYYTEISNNMKQLDFLKAAEYCLEVIKIDPKDEKVRSLFAECMKKFEEIKAANFSQEKKELADLFRSGQSAYGAGAYFTARKNYEDIKDNPYASWFQKWIAGRRLKNIQSYLTRVIAGELSVPLKNMHYARGLQYYIVGDVSSSMNEFEKSYSINPENRELPSVLAELRGGGPKRQTNAPTKKQLSRAKDLIANGVKYYRSKKYKEAIESWKEAVSLDSTNEDKIRKRIKKAEILMAAELETEKDDLLEEPQAPAREPVREREIAEPAPEPVRERETAETPAPPKEIKEQPAPSEETPEPPAAKAVSSKAPSKKAAAAVKKAEPKQPAKETAKVPSKKLSSDEVRKLYNEGLQAYAIGNLDKAIKLWSDVVDNDPENKRAAANLSRAQRELKSR